jgi:sigma-E factor negative regulatory protein RseC
MNNPADSAASLNAAYVVEGIAHVVAVDGEKAWLEPEQTGSCGSCAASGACGAKGIGTVASRLESRRFQIENSAGLRVGERVVVGIRENTLIKASIVAYAMPLATMFGAGIAAQWAKGEDGITMIAMVAGLLLGIGLMKLGAGHLSNRGELVPHYLRRARPGETCNT